MDLGYRELRLTQFRVYLPCAHLHCFFVAIGSFWPVFSDKITETVRLERCKACLVLRRFVTHDDSQRDGIPGSGWDAAIVTILVENTSSHWVDNLGHAMILNSGLAAVKALLTSHIPGFKCFPGGCI
jgi:hypothetical protein